MFGVRIVYTFSNNKAYSCTYNKVEIFIGLAPVEKGYAKFKQSNTKHETVEMERAQKLYS